MKNPSSAPAFLAATAALLAAALIFVATHVSVQTHVAAQTPAGLQPETSSEECPQDVKDALEAFGVDNSDANALQVLNDVPCWSSAGEGDNCPTAATYYTDCGLCCPPDTKPERSKCMKWQDELGEGDFCGYYGFFRENGMYLKVASCTEDYICNGNSNMEDFHTCHKKPSLDQFDCWFAAVEDGSASNAVTPRDLLSIVPLAVKGDVDETAALLENRSPNLNCGHYIHKGEPLFCEVNEADDSGRCKPLPKSGDSCDVEADYDEQCGRGIRARIPVAPGVQVDTLSHSYRLLKLGEMRTHTFGGENVFAEEDSAIRMKCDAGKCRFLEEGEECDPGDTPDFVCGWGLLCRNNKDDIYAFGENDAAETKYTCQKERFGGEKCGYPGLGCTDSTYCDSVPNMKTDDARQELFEGIRGVALNQSVPLPPSFPQLLLRCGVYCDGKMSKIDFAPADGSSGDCVCTGKVDVDEDGEIQSDDRERCKFDDVFQSPVFRQILENVYQTPEDENGLGLASNEYALPAASNAEDDCPTATETEGALAENFDGKQGSCGAPNFINEEHKIGNPCYISTSSGNRVCESHTPPQGPDAKCSFDDQCVNRDLGVVGLVKRLGFVEDYDFGESCKFNPEDSDANEEECDCACGPNSSGSSGVCRNSEAPNIQGSSFICSARLVLYARCLHDNQCSQRYSFAFTSDPLPIQEEVGNCATCRSELKTLAIDCLRPSAVASDPTRASSRIPPISAYFYYGGVYMYGGRAGEKNRLFIGAFFGVFFALCLSIAGCCYACKKHRDKKRAKRDGEGDGEGDKKSNAVVPKGDA